MRHGKERRKPFACEFDSWCSQRQTGVARDRLGQRLDAKGATVRNVLQQRSAHKLHFRARRAICFVVGRAEIDQFCALDLEVAQQQHPFGLLDEKAATQWALVGLALL